MHRRSFRAQARLAICGGAALSLSLLVFVDVRAAAATTQEILPCVTVIDERDLQQDLLCDCLMIGVFGTLHTNGYTLTITNPGGLTCYGTLDIDSRGNIPGRVVLSGGGTSQVRSWLLGLGSKRILLSNSSSRLEIVGRSHVISGDGSIIGENNGAEIRIAAAAEQISLTNNVALRGMLKVRGLTGGAGQFDGKFVNGATGSVMADASGALDILEGDVADVRGAEWMVLSNVNAILRFNIGATNLAGDFIITFGMLDIDQPVHTSGNLRFTGGLIDVAPEQYFIAGQ
jgi:hypothetical protein